MFYIMNASCLFDEKPTTVEAIREEWKDSEQTVLVCLRETSPGSNVRIFVVGSGLGYNVNVNDRFLYTEDTGNGYRNKGKVLYVQNVIEIASDGTMRSENANGMFGEKRRVWVMK